MQGPPNNAPPQFINQSNYAYQPHQQIQHRLTGATVNGNPIMMDSKGRLSTDGSQSPLKHSANGAGRRNANGSQGNARKTGATAAASQSAFPSN